jgi:predicted RNA binding protein YcfA (HicA-like mRNA interferase family)
VGKLPVLKPRAVIAALQKLGFSEIRQRGSHKQFKHADGRMTTVPVHGGRDISPNLLRKIIEDVGITSDKFLRYV